MLLQNFQVMEKTTKNTRKRKLQAQHRQRTYDYTTVPCLHLAGNWLAETGFKIGDQVEIIVDKNQLIIKPL
jgi:hypothetical protein